MAKRKLRMSRRQAMAQKWRPLYETADRIKELAPWQWMEEQHIFGVQDPETGEIGFVSVMGLLGEHLCIGVYLGANAINQFWALEEIADSQDQWEIGSRLLVIPQMQASFENQNMVEKEDAGIMRKLNLTYRGRSAFPVFRSYHPGCPPALLDMDKIPFLNHILEQTLDVAPRYKEDISLLFPEDVGDDEMYLLRVPTEQDGNIVWADEIRPIPAPVAQDITIDVDTEVYEALQDVPRVGNSVEIDLFMLMEPVTGKWDKRPFFPFTLLIADADSGMILSHDLLSPLPSIEDMYGKVPQKIIELLLRNNMLPYEIHTQSPIITAVLSTLFDKLDIPVVERPVLPMVNEAKAAMFRHLGDGFD
ncbi:MAG: hypothetical protein GY943_15560 [Chloroflexi bacterium]|nr:hypothetical protein [Chloroflexota bacterium]